MKRLLRGMCATVMAGALAGAAVPALAMPYHPAPVYRAPASTDVVNAGWAERRFYPSHVERKTGFSRYRYRHHYRGGPNRFDGRFHHHRRYRRHHDHGDFGPAAGFIAGAIVGGIIANSPPHHHRASSAHVRWCYGHYRSYRASDNTFQPYHGPRKRCNSPYD